MKIFKITNKSTISQKRVLVVKEKAKEILQPDIKRKTNKHGHTLKEL